MLINVNVSFILNQLIWYSSQANIVCIPADVSVIVSGGNFENSKLAALQQVLQSDFCAAVREVYEHVYETVDITGSPEVRASATAKVCSWISQICHIEHRTVTSMTYFVIEYPVIFCENYLNAETFKMQNIFTYVMRVQCSHHVEADAVFHPIIHTVWFHVTLYRWYQGWVQIRIAAAGIGIWIQKFGVLELKITKGYVFDIWSVFANTIKYT